MVAGLGVESKSPDSQSREQNGTTSLIFHVFSPDQSYPPTLSAANEHANSSTTTACLGHSGTSKLACSSPYALMYHASTHLPSLVHNHFSKDFPMTSECTKQLHHLQQREAERTTSGLSDHTKKSCTTGKDHVIKGRPSWINGPSPQ